MLTIYGVSIILCFIKILYGSRNRLFELINLIDDSNCVNTRQFSFSWPTEKLAFKINLKSLRFRRFVDSLIH